LVNALLAAARSDDAPYADHENETGIHEHRPPCLRSFDPRGAEGRVSLLNYLADFFEECGYSSMTNGVECLGSGGSMADRS
jgi:hypothetical protein